ALYRCPDETIDIFYRLNCTKRGTHTFRIPADQDPHFYDPVVLEKFISLMREVGRFPVRGELKLKSRTHKGFPTHNVFARLGSKQHLAKKLLSHCEGRAGYKDVVALCQPIAAKHVSPVPDANETVIGFVYLVKSGRYYKLGRSNAAGRREYELSIQMPEKPTTLHTIRTDDPVGIEAYWHQRFEAKRKNGEWFDLDTADVTAFKRRKFM
ncbi:MAG: GIY-YIG nuclease family protein, partial [Bryobacteraceae bacterium]